MENVTNLRMFAVRFVPPTNTKGSRVRIKDLRNDVTVIISWDYRFNDSAKVAFSYLSKVGIKVDFQSWDEHTKDIFLMTSDFETSIKG